MSMNRAVNYFDIAKAAKCSRSTVSRALSNHPAISKTVKERVLQISRRLGYQKNPLISILTAQIRSSRIRTIESTLAYMTTFPTSQLENAGNPTYGLFFTGAKKRAEELGYRLEPIWRRENRMTSARFKTILVSRGIKGILVAPRPLPLSHLKMDWNGFSAVSIGHHLPGAPIHTVRMFDDHLIRDSLRQIKKYGYQRVGFAILPISNRYSENLFYSHYFYDQSTLPEKYRVSPLYRPHYSREITYGEFISWFKKERPEVLLTTGPVIPEWLQRGGYSVPNDVALVDLCIAEVNGARAGIWDRGDIVGSVAAEFLVDQLNRNETGIPEYPKTILINGTWVDGKNLPKRR